jgi:hypothetical protein
VGIRFARGAKSGWRAGNLHFRLQTTHEWEPLLAVLGLVGDRLVEWDPGDEVERGAKYVSTPLRMPDGVAFWLDAPDAWPALVDRLVAIIVEGLESAGVDGRLSGPAEPPQPHLGARTLLIAIPRGAPPSDVLADGLDWVLALGASEVFVGVGGMWVALPPSAIPGYLDFHHEAGRSYEVQARSDREQRVLALGHPSDGRLAGSSGDSPHVTRVRSGPVVTDDVDAAFEAAVDAGRAVGDWAVWVAVQVNPRNVDSVVVRPAWTYGPNGLEARVGLIDHVLAPAPWQQVTALQAQHLPPPDDHLRYDAERGELRVGRLDDWLREPLTARRHDFERATRARLGRALLSRDVVWERLHPEMEPGVDPATIPLSGHALPHPSLGAMPVELLGLARHQPFSEDVAALSPVLRCWLAGFRGSCADRPDEVRRVVLTLAAADSDRTDEPEVDRHREVLVDWLLRDLTPNLLAVAGLDEDFVAHLPPTNVPTRPTELIDPVLERLHLLLAQHDHTAEPEASSNADLRHLREVVHSTANAASLVAGPTNHQPASGVGSTLLHAPWWSGPLPATAARQLWWAAADTAGLLAFEEAYYRARTAEPRLEPRWREAEMHRGDRHSSYGPPFELFCDPSAFIAAGRAVMKAPTAAAAWDEAVTAARSATPWWNGLERALAGLLPADQLQRSWQAGRRALEGARPLARRVATIAAAAQPAARICDLAALAAVQQQLDEDLQATLWSATQRLVDRLCQES